MGRKRTHDEFVKELGIIQPDVFVLGTYMGRMVKILVRYKNKDYYVYPCTMLKGRKPVLKPAIMWNTATFCKKVESVYPNSVVLSEYKNSRSLIYITSNGVLYKQRADALLIGTNLSTMSIVDRKIRAIELIKKRHPEIFNISEYEHSNGFIYFQTVYGSCRMKYFGLVNSGTILISASTNKTEYWINMAREKHGDKYDYSKVSYINNNTKVCIICPIHGEFWQSAGCHLQGQGCKKCGFISMIEKNKENDNNGFISPCRAERRVKSWVNELVIIYCIRCWNENEEFYKIGITKNIKNRFYTKDRLPYNYEIVKTITMDKYEAAHLEVKLHKDNKENRYTPLLSFNGHTECFNKIT